LQSSGLFKTKGRGKKRREVQGMCGVITLLLILNHSEIVGAQ
jgi:hypothetical protein